MAPLLLAQEIRDRDLVELPLRIADDEPQCLRIALRPDRKVLPRVAIIEDALELAIEIIPSHPRLDRRLFEIIQDIRRQLDVTAVAVEFEDAILRDCAGSVGEENRQGELQEQPRQPAGHADGPQIGQPVHGLFA